MRREYAVAGALLECSLGNMIAKLNPTNATGTQNGQGRPGIEIDYGADNIIGTFGECRAHSNESGLCVKAVQGPWQDTSLSSGYYIPPPFVQRFSDLVASIIARRAELEADLDRVLAEMGAPMTATDFLLMLHFMSLDPRREFPFRDPQRDMISDYRDWANSHNNREWANSYIGFPRRHPLSPFEIPQLQNHFLALRDRSGESVYFADRIADIGLLMDIFDRMDVDPQITDNLTSAQRSLSTLIRENPHFFLGVPFLLVGSVLHCLHDGVITIVHCGQVQDSDEDDSQFEDLRERVKAVIRLHYGVGTPAEDSVREQFAQLLPDDENREENLDRIMRGLAIQTLQARLAAAEAAALAAREAPHEAPRAYNYLNEIAMLNARITELNAQLEEFGNLVLRQGAITRKNEILSGLGNNFRVQRIMHQAIAAERTITELRIDVETDRLKLLAWLVLLNENNIWHSQDDDGNSSFSLDNAIAETMINVAAGAFTSYGIYSIECCDDCTDDACLCTEESLCRKIKECEEDAHSIPNPNCENEQPNGRLSVYHPIPDRPMSSDYGPFNRDDPRRPRHGGLDFRTAHADYVPCYAAVSGVVMSRAEGRGRNTTLIQRGNEGEWPGNYVEIYDHLSRAMMYAHLHTVNAIRREFVLAGRFIGHAGNTGHSFGIHLHFEITQPGETLTGALEPTVDPAAECTNALPKEKREYIRNIRRGWGFDV